VLLLNGTTNLQARAVIERQLSELATARVAATGDVFALPDTENATKNLRSQLEVVGDLAQQVATLGDRFGILPRRIVDTVRGVGALAEQGKKLQEAFKPGSGVGALGKLGIGVGIAAGITSLVAGVLNDPAERQRRDEMRANTEALRNLTARVGDLASSSISGNALDRAGAATARIVRGAATGRGIIGSSRVDVDEAARAAGLTRAEFEEVAKSLLPTFNGTVDAFRQLDEAIRQADLKAFTDTFAGSLQRLDDTLRLDGITDPIEILRRRIATLSSPTTGFPALAAALEGVDLDSVDGRNAAADRARALFDQLASGQLSAGQLGGLSITDARTAIVDLVSSLRDSTAGSGTGGFNESRSITEVTGSRLAGLLGTGNTYLAQIAADLAVVREAFSLGPVPVLRTPSLPSGLTATATAGGVVITGGLTIQLTLSREVLGADPVTAALLGERLGQALGASFVDTIDQQLQQRVLRQRLINGDPRLS
jgi:hypothetical protein